MSRRGRKDKQIINRDGIDRGVFRVLRLDSYPDKLIEFVGSKTKVTCIFFRQYHRLNEVNFLKYKCKR